jgi:hypothetical protein
MERGERVPMTSADATEINTNCMKIFVVPLLFAREV